MKALRKSIVPLAMFLMMASEASAQMRSVPSLCRAKEKTVWSCHSSRRTYSLCASSDLGSSDGYLQYRAGTNGKVDFIFPSTLTHPRGHFEYDLAAHGVGISFQNGRYRYDIGQDPGRNAVAIWVHDHRSIDKIIQCSNDYQTLDDNSTMDLFKAAGISDVP